MFFLECLTISCNLRNMHTDYFLKWYLILLINNYISQSFIYVSHLFNLILAQFYRFIHYISTTSTTAVCRQNCLANISDKTYSLQALISSAIYMYFLFTGNIWKSNRIRAYFYIHHFFCFSVIHRSIVVWLRKLLFSLGCLNKVYNHGTSNN